MNKPPMLRILEDAQLAHQSGDFTNALKFYEHFFDHALDENPTAFYGIRLSHCLRGWSRLAKEFPGAQQRLEEKQQDALSEFKLSQNPESFNDYLEISTHLGVREDAISEFVSLFEETPTSAAKLVRYVWNDLVKAEYWDVCNTLLDEPNLKLDELFAIFDERSKMRDIDPAFDSLDFEQHTVDQLLADVQKTITVLRHQNRGDEIAALERQFFQGVQSRNHGTLNKQVTAKGAFLFAAH
jgi:hypothetical protein